MKNQHTPGPWQFDNSALTGRIDIRKNHANGDSRILVYVWSDQNGDSNANLIASAPDLLSALKETIEYLETFACHDEQGRAAIKSANAAISKAEGVA